MSVAPTWVWWWVWSWSEVVVVWRHRQWMTRSRMRRVQYGCRVSLGSPVSSSLSPHFCMRTPVETLVSASTSSTIAHARSHTCSHTLQVYYFYLDIPMWTHIWLITPPKSPKYTTQWGNWINEIFVRTSNSKVMLYVDLCYECYFNGTNILFEQKQSIKVIGTPNCTYQSLSTETFWRQPISQIKLYTHA